MIVERHTTDIDDMTLNDSRILRESFHKLDKENNFSRFDYYMIDKWNGIPYKVLYEELSPADIDNMRRNSYRNFCKKTKGIDVGSQRTIKKWFGIGEYVPPKRDMIFKYALNLHLTAGETRDYLVNGLMMPEFQINDYHEIIYLYGLYNEYDYNFCNKMIQLFEENMGYDATFTQGSHTDELWRGFELKKSVKTEEFLDWMMDNKNMFKGYSKTVLECFQRMKKEITQYIKKDAKEYLDELLEQNGYEKWKAESGNPDSEKNISDYIRYLTRYSNGRINEGTVESMRKAYNTVYGRDNNSGILREIYTIYNNDEKNDAFMEKISGFKKDGISFMTDKHMSQIINIAEQKSEYMRMKNIKVQLDSMSEDTDCPEELYDYIISRGKNPKDRTVNECKKLIAYYLKNQNQRCKLIGREDILPLIHYIAQKRYAEILKEEKRDYDMKEARNYFTEIANAVMLKCGMAPISPNYKGDYLMLSSFSKEDMYSLNDMIEISVQV